eukprot:SAG31_NODE_37_length_31616_cov_38.688359_11_plen_171_part_00
MSWGLRPDDATAPNTALLYLLLLATAIQLRHVHTQEGCSNADVCYCILDDAYAYCTEDAACMGPCYTTIRRFGANCSDHASLGEAAETLNTMIEDCNEEEGCMDDRYSNFNLTHNVQASDASCIDDEAPDLLLRGGSAVTVNQVCGRSFQLVNAACTAGKGLLSRFCAHY